MKMFHVRLVRLFFPEDRKPDVKVTICTSDFNMGTDDAYNEVRHLDLIDLQGYMRVVGS